MGFELICFEKKDGVATLTLNRPKQLNAINSQMIGEILEAIADAGADPDVRVLVLRGEGRAFSAGDDLKGMGPISRKVGSDSLSQQLEQHPRFIRALRGLLKPVIAGVQGYALGAACEMVLASDLIIAAEDARIGLPYVQRGIASGTYSLQMSIGYRKACEMLFLGDWISGRDAERMGLINRAVPPDQLDEAVAEMSGRLAKGATTAIAYMKQAMNTSPAIDWEAGLTLQTLIQKPVQDTEDAQEGRKSFIEKREPHYKGR